MAGIHVNRRAGLVAAAGFGVLVGSFVVAAVRDGQAQKKSQDVFVVNTATDAIPTAAQGTTNIAGAVSISNTPTVALGPGGTVGIDPSANTVQVASTDASPLWIRDVDSARQPFQISALITIPDGQLLGTGTVTTVPAGKRLVIEYASARLPLPTGQQFMEVVLQSPPRTYSHFLTPILIGGNGIVDVFSASQQLRLYANPGEDVLAAASRNGVTGGATLEVSLSGYYVDVP